MLHFLSNNYTGYWKSVMFGPHKPMVLDTKTRDHVPKDPRNYIEEDFQKLELDAKAHAQLATALPNEIYSGFFHHESAKDWWNALKEQFGGTDDVVANTREILAQQSSPDFGKLSLTQLHGKLLTFEREIDQKIKLIKSGKSTEEYVQGNTALLSHNTETNDQGYDEYIDITTGITSSSSSSSSSCDDHSLISDHLCFIMDDLHQIPSDDLEEMDILHQLALLSMRTNKFYKRTGRKFPGIHGKTKIGLNKAKVQCYRCHGTGHFTRECKNAPNSNFSPYVTLPNTHSHTSTTPFSSSSSSSSSSHFKRHNNSQETAHIVQNFPSTSVQYVQDANGPAIQSSSSSQPALFTQEYVDWSNMPEDVGYALITSEPTEFALMAVGDDSTSSDQPEAESSDA
ncbi:hypothetical protein E3N88_09027 [Mikania micrantha]|uniref:CCHC-type domain-containing protein n=1 Tax=Mikania micrantha TaxID=192012 RepID=A0A5N6PJX4_9ASTR|nr:hypothetical protein E3N88_09027 [Mikania micrantha]